MAEALGCGIHYSDEVAPRIIAPVLKRLEDVDKLRMPDPEKDHPLPEMLKCMRILRKEIGHQAFIFGRADQAPLSLSAALMGYEKFFVHFSDPDSAAAIDKLLDFCVEATTHYALASRPPATWDDARRIRLRFHLPPATGDSRSRG